VAIIKNKTVGSKLYSIFSFLLLSSLIVSAQSIQVNGKVINAKNEPLAGATVSVEGISRALAANVEGRFSVSLEPGKRYTIVVSSVGYTTKSLEDVEVKPNEENNLTVVLEEKSTLSEVVVRTSVRKESTSALLNFQKNNTAVSSGLAADFIRRTPDRNTGEILKRVSGTSIQDNKFVVVRGLGDRYNTAFLNGAQLPSSEPDRKSFSFDVIPASVVDNIVINKTATPDLTGEFAGGLIQVTTKDVPSKNFLSIGATFGYNTNSTFKDFKSNPRSTDWTGFGDNRRDLPAGFPANRAQFTGTNDNPTPIAKKVEYSRLFRDDVYSEKQYKAAPIQTYNIAWGVGKKLKNGGSFGSVISVLYRKSENLAAVEKNFFQQDGVSLQSYTDEQNKYGINLGAMANFSYVKGKHKISFKNLFNRTFEDNYYFRHGPNNDRGGGDVHLWSSVLTQRTFYTGIFEGSHQVTTSGIKFNWNAGYSFNNKSQPDLRTSAYYDGGDGYEWDSDDSRRFFSNLEDHGVSGSASLTFPFKIKDEKQLLKVGGSGLLRFRHFKSRIFRYEKASESHFNESYSFLPFDKIFAKSNIAEDGFSIDEFTNPDDKYNGISSLNAGYVMLDNKISEKLRVTWGARVEFFEQYLNTKDKSAKRTTVDNEQWSVLPSANISYSINPKTLIRVSGSQTVSRPEFRELAPFQFFDYEANYGVRGKSDLKSTDIYNIDVRYEMYPGTGEAITLGGFYKRFVNPIEFRLSPESNPSRRNYEYGNAKDADTYGLELELRKNLNFLGSSDILSDFSIFANLTYIFSQVRFSDENAGKVVSSDRPVQGQSPYLINGGIQYSSKATGWNGNILYNRVGNRLALVGNSFMPDIYENPRDIVDIQISKKVLDQKAELKLTLGDILNKSLLFYENADNPRTFKRGSDRVFSSYKPGSTISLGFTYDFSL
jgi:hypothetical protein